MAARKKISQLSIPRGDDTARQVEVFEVPYEEGASILDGLIWIRENLDSSLAFRYSCISANVCRECVMLIDGETGYACVERLRPGPMELAPLAKKKVLRDLACDTIPPKERL